MKMGEKEEIVRGRWRRTDYVDKHLLAPVIEEEGG